MSIDAVTPHAIPQLAIFTDFDGTLVEIAETPDAVEVADTLTAPCASSIAPLPF